MRFKLNDRYIKGTVVFERSEDGNTAKMSFQGAGKLPANAKYEIDGDKWRVISVTPSDYNLGVYNADLELV